MSIILNLNDAFFDIMPLEFIKMQLQMIFNSYFKNWSDIVIIPKRHLSHFKVTPYKIKEVPFLMKQLIVRKCLLMKKTYNTYFQYFEEKDLKLESR